MRSGSFRRSGCSPRGTAEGSVGSVTVAGARQPGVGLMASVCVFGGRLRDPRGQVYARSGARRYHHGNGWRSVPKRPHLGGQRSYPDIRWPMTPR